MKEEVIIDIQIKGEEVAAKLAATTKTIADLKNENIALKKSTKESGDAFGENAKQVALNNQKIKDLGVQEKLLSNQIVLTDKEAKGLNTTMKAQELELDSLKLKYANLTQAQRDSAKGQELKKSIDDLDASVKKGRASIGDFQRDIGNYEKANRRLPGVFGEIQDKANGMFSSLKSGISEISNLTKDFSNALLTQKTATEAAKVASTEAAIAEQALATAEKEGTATAELAAVAETKRAEATLAASTATEAGAVAMKIFKFALASTGIGILVVALGSLVAYFTQTNEGVKKFKQITAGLNGDLQQFWKIAGEIGDVLFNTFGKSGNIMNYFKAVLASLVLPLKTIFLLINAIKEGDFKAGISAIKNFGTEWVENTKTIITAGLGVVKDLGTATLKTSDVIAKANTKSFKDAHEQSIQLEKDRQRLTIEERNWSVEKIKQQGIIDVLALKVRQSDISPEERKKAATEAKRLNDEVFKVNIEHAKENLRIINEQQKLNSNKDYQAIADAKNSLTQIISERDRFNQELLNKEAKVNNTMARQTKADLKDKQKDQEAYAKIYNEVQNTILDNTVKGIDFQVEQTKLGFDKQIGDLKRLTGLTEQEITERNALVIRLEQLRDAKVLDLRLSNELKIAQETNDIVQEQADQEKDYNDKLAKTEENRQLTDIDNQLATTRSLSDQELALKIESLNIKKEAELKTSDDTEASKLFINQKYAALQVKLEEETTQARLAAVSGMLGQAAGLFEKNTVAYKALASAQALIDTYTAAQAAYKSLVGIPVVGTILAPIGAGVAVAAGLKNVAAINAVDTTFKAANGLVVPGNSYSGDNIPVMTNSGEEVLTMKDRYSVASALRNIPTGGIDYNKMAQAMANISPVVSVKEINLVNQRVNVLENLSQY